MGLSRLDMVPNHVLFRRAGIPSKEDVLRARRLKWLGHVARMGAERVATQLLFAHEVPGASGPPPPMWADLVRADLEAQRAQLGGEQGPCGRVRKGGVGV